MPRTGRRPIPTTCATPRWRSWRRGESSLRLSLDGPWKFHYALNIHQAPEGFEQPDYDCGGWADIPVPAHVQMEGYGVPQYCNIQYPWDGYEALEPGEIPKDFNPVMSYVKRFYLPEGFAGKRVFVSFQGAESFMFFGPKAMSLYTVSSKS